MTSLAEALDWASKQTGKKAAPIKILVATIAQLQLRNKELNHQIDVVQDSARRGWAKAKEAKNGK